MKPFSSHTDSDRFTAVYKRIIPRCVSDSPRVRNIRKIGIATAIGGIIRVERMKNIRSSLSGTLNRENA